MLSQRMIQCLEHFVLDHEGRINEDVSGDPGGKTHWGITQADYDAYRTEHGMPHADVFGMSVQEVYACYQEHYWMPMHCDAIPQKLDLVVFDTAVNMGCGKATRLLQTGLGLAVDGVFGPNTGAAAASVKDVTKAASLYLNARENAYRDLVTHHMGLTKFLKGWLQRCEDLRGHLA